VLRTDHCYTFPLDYGEVEGGFAYRMNFVSDDFINLESILAGDNLPLGLKASLSVAINFIEALQNISSRGLCYGDISFDNLLINPKTHAVCIIDLDNLVRSREDRIVEGSAFFGAPENKGVALPESDMFAFAIYLFTLLVYQHPYDGPLNSIEDKNNQESIIRNGQFIFSKNQSVNTVTEPIACTRWQLLSEELRMLFSNTFENSTLVDQRPRYVKWRYALKNFQNNTVECSCGFAQVSQTGHVICNNCAQIIPHFRIEVNQGESVGVVDQKQCIIPDMLLKKNDGDWVLKNTGKMAVTCRYKGRSYQVARDSSVLVKTDLIINFKNDSYRII